MSQLAFVMTDLPPRRRLSVSVVLAAAGVGVVAGLVVAGCAQPDAIPFRPAELQEAELSAASQTQYRRLQPPTATGDESDVLDVVTLTNEQVRLGNEVDTGEIRPATTQPAEAGGVGGVVALPLSECIQRATLNNYDVAVAAYEPGIEGSRVTEALAQFDPVFRQQLEFQYADRQITNFNSFLDSAAVINDLQRTYTSNTSLVQPLPSGGEASLTYQAQRLNSPTNVSRGLSVLDTTYESDLSLRFTQPLLRDFGSDINRARIVINQNTQQVSVLEFRNTLEETLLAVEEAYWQLYRAQREVEIQQDLLARTIETADRIKLRLGGDANSGQVAQALQSIFERRAALLTAEAAVAQLSDELKLLMNDPDLPVSGPAIIATTTEPIEAPLLFDLEDALEVALLYRTEIAQQLLRVRSASTALKVGRNNVLPRLDLVLSGGFQGLDEDYGGAVSNQFGFDNLAFGAGVQFEIPLGNREARAVLRRALQQREQAITQYLALVQQITNSVKNAQRQVSLNYALLAQQRQRVEAAEEAVRVVQVQEETDAQLTPEFSDRKLRFLDNLAAARSAEAQALAEYNASLAAYERSRGTLLRYNNIVIGETADYHLITDRVDAVDDLQPAR